MIGTVEVRVSVGHNECPLNTVTLYKGSAHTIGVLDVPKARCGVTITGVAVSIENASGTESAVSAVKVGGVWCATFPATHFTAVGEIANGLSVTAAGKDENGTVRSWIVGTGDVAVVDTTSAATPGETVTHITDKTLSGQTLDITTIEGTGDALKIVLQKLGATVVGCLLAVCCASSASLADILPDTVTTNGVTWARLGSVPYKTGYVVTNVVTGGSGGGVTTNDVNALIASPAVTNAGAVAAAQAYADGATNAVTTDVAAKYLPWVVDGSGNRTAVTIGKRGVGNVGRYSFANGEGVVASGDYSHADGLSTKARGLYSHAEEVSTTASGDYSHAEGVSTTASGVGSHAEGESTTASGDCSHAEGESTTASGHYSHAEGVSTTASGQYSHAEGYTSVASNNYAFAWNGDPDVTYGSHGKGTFNVNPVGGLSGLYIGDTNAAGHMASALASATNGLARAEDVRTLKGALYDFGNGTNFTLRLYTALTNVIERMGGSITNAPNFN